jgi:hypothetical protein
MQTGPLSRFEFGDGWDLARCSVVSSGNTGPARLTPSVYIMATPVLSIGTFSPFHLSLFHSNPIEYQRDGSMDSGKPFTHAKAVDDQGARRPKGRSIRLSGRREQVRYT